MANRPFKITTPVGAGLQRDPSTGRLLAGTTNEAPPPSPAKLVQQAEASGVDVIDILKVQPAPSGPPALPGPPFVRPPLPFRVS